MPSGESSPEPTGNGHAEVVRIRAQPQADQPGPRPAPEPPQVIRADITSHPWTTAPVRRPVIPAWMRREHRTAAAKWLAANAGHTAAFHGLRAPFYVVRTMAHSPRGAGRATVLLSAWLLDREGHALRWHSIDAKDPKLYLALSKQRNDRVKARGTGLAAGLAGGTAAVVLAAAAWHPAGWIILGASVAFLGWLGRPAGKPFIPHATITPRAERLTPEIITRALGSLGIAEINKTLREGRPIVFAAPVTRDGPGWRAEIDLPYGVVAVDIIERRDRLASGLRRPLGCVWPDPVHDEHAGRLVLWVGDQDMSRARQPAWPLAKNGTADVFKPVPFGTDQRGRPAPVTLIFTNALIGSIPRQGKTMAVRVLALACALDVTVEMHVWELKGTGDLSALEPVASRYGSGPDDATVAACVADLHAVHKDLERRAKVIAGLPKDVCPENKVTPALARRKSLRLHPVAFIVDECQELYSHPEHGKAAEALSVPVIKRGPALGVFLILATQRPDKNSLPTGISANVSVRFCLRVMGQVENDMILGTSSYRNGLRATTFTTKDKGIGYLAGAADDPQIVRTYYIDAPAAERIGERARQLRAAAGTLVTAAPAPAADVSLIADVAAVIALGEDKMWSVTVCERLAELRPGLYAGWTPERLAEALKPYGVATQQVWANGVNRRGVTRADVLGAVRTSAPGARPSTTVSEGTDDRPAD